MSLLPIALAVDDKNMHRKQRAFTRLPGESQIEVFWDDTIMRGELRDISVGGAGFYLDEPGKATDLLLLLNPSENGPGLLMHRIENLPERGRSLVRARFASLDRPDALYLAGYLQRLETESESARLASRFAPQRTPRV